MQHDLVVIGAGPGGYVAAIRAAQLGLNVACVEKEASLGGTCLRVGCIPSKALLESSHLYHMARHELGAHGIHVGDCSFDLAAMLKRKDQIVDQLTKGVDSLFRKNKVTRYTGHGRPAGRGKVVIEGTERVELTAKHVILAPGSKPFLLPGVAVDGVHVGTSTESLAYDKVPERLVVIDGKQCVVRCEGVDPITCDKVLLSVGRVPNTDDVGLDTVGIELDEKRRIPVDAHLRTSVPDVYAIGDCTAGPMLAHKAEEEGMAAAEFIATGYGHVNYDAIPSVVYTEPEIASVGKTEDELKSSGREYRKGSFPFSINGRAKGLNQTEGYVKILADTKTDRVLGVHIIGPRAGDLIAEAAAAMEFGASAEDIARTCHAHPTLAEVVKEAALSVAGRAIHR